MSDLKELTLEYSKLSVMADSKEIARVPENPTEKDWVDCVLKVQNFYLEKESQALQEARAVIEFYSNPDQIYAAGCSDADELWDHAQAISLKAREWLEKWKGKL